MLLFLPKWVSLEYTTVAIFQGSKNNIHNRAVVANKRYDSVSFTDTNQEGCSSIFKRILIVRSLFWHYIFLLVNSSGTTYHSLHALHINVVITRNARYISASREFGTRAQNFNAKRKHFFRWGVVLSPTNSTAAAAPVEICEGWQQPASGPSPERSAAPGEQGDMVSTAPGVFLFSKSFNRLCERVNAHTPTHSLLAKEGRHINHRSSPGCN